MKNVITIATQELNVLLAKMKLEFDSLVALYGLDGDAIKLLNKILIAWESYILAELKLVEHKWSGDPTQALHVNTKHQELVISFIKELKKKIEFEHESLHK